MQPMPPMYVGQPQPPKNSGATILLIVLCVLGGLIVVVGIMAVLAIAGVRKYIANAKIAEALNGVSTIAKDAAARYQDSLASGPAGLCSSASQPVPVTASLISGRKYPSSASDWDVDQSTNGGFACVGFEMSTPQYFQYDYQRSGSSTGNSPGDAFRAIAHGDLNADSKLSTFSIGGKFVAPEILVLDDTVSQIDPTE